MKNVPILLLLLLPSFLSAQKGAVKIIDTQDGSTVILTAKNITDLDQSIDAKLYTRGFGLEPGKRVTDTIPANSEKELIRFTALKEGEGSYTYEFHYGPIIGATAEESAASNIKEGEGEGTVPSDLAESIERNGSKRIKVYTQNGCERSQTAVDFMIENRISYENLNLTLMPREKAKLSEKLYASGYKGGPLVTPYIELGDKVYFDIKDLDAFLEKLAEGK